MDRADARRRLWERYDAGDATAEEVEARLRMLDRAPDGHGDALRAAIEGPIPLRHRGGGRRTAVLLGCAALVLLLIGGAFLAGEDGNGSPSPTSGVATNVGIANLPLPPGGIPGVTVFEDGQVLVAEGPDCPQAEGADNPTDPPANPALLSEPAFVPEGYVVDDDEEIVPGTDPDLTMSVSAGDPLPDEIRARVLDGDLSVRMRSFRYADDDTAASAARAAALSGCSYAAEAFIVHDHPEIGGSVVSGVIPRTAFAGWRLAERRFVVAVETAGEDPEALEEAQQLAGVIASAELDAARNPPTAPAP